MQYNFAEELKDENREIIDNSPYAGTSSVVYRAKLTGNGGAIDSYGFNYGKQVMQTKTGGDINLTANGDFIFDVTIYNIKDIVKDLEGLTVTPFVNYVVGTTSETDVTE